MSDNTHIQPAAGSTQQAASEICNLQSAICNFSTPSPPHPPTPSPRKRRASVLILVVALLVLMALIGTAYISSTRIERYTSNQNSTNTQADLLFQGLVNAVKGTVSGELYVSSTTGAQFRPPPTFTQIFANYSVYTNTFNEYNSSFTDLFLADRMPVNSVNGSVNAAIPAVWGNISWPLFAPPVSTINYAFDLPNGVGGNTQINIGTADLKNRYQACPGSISVGGQTMPALTIYDTVNGVFLAPSAPGAAASTSPGPFSGNPVWFLAADADGDGIADSGLWQLPGGPVNGITYYAALRIVDNNSALNVNTAISSISDFAAASGAPVDGAGAPMSPYPPIAPAQNLGMFPSNVGLMQILPDYQTTAGTSSDMTAVLHYIFQDAAPPTSMSPTGNWNDAYDDTTQAKRLDFAFTTIGDNLATQLTRRLGNPGYVTATLAYQPFSTADSSQLAYRFCLRDTSLPLTTLETEMSNSLQTSAFITIPTAPYSPANVAAWFNSNFNLVHNVRPLIVTSNAVSDFVPSHFVLNGTTPQPLNPRMLPYKQPPTYDGTAAYSPGLFVQYTDISVTNAKARTFDALTIMPPNNNTPPITATHTVDTTNWREEIWTDTPTKANINTATFATLWRAFYNVMAGDTGDTVPPVPTATVTPNPAVTSPILSTAPGWGPFRSSSRNANILTSAEMLQIRSACAAINAMDMRDSDDDVTSRQFVIYSDSPSNTILKYTVTVFGIEKQPFIDMVVVDANNGVSTQVSIELYNPTSTAIALDNWQIGSIDHSSANLTVTALGAIPAGTVVPANGYLILQGTGAANITPGTQPGPSGSTEIFAIVPGLQNAIPAATAQIEIVLLKPRRADAGNPLTDSTVYDNTFNETTSINDLVPVDMVDTTNVFAATDSGRRVYERPHGPDPAAITSGYNWQFVYPGIYNPAAVAAGTPPQSGWTPSPSFVTTTPAGATQSDGTNAGGANAQLYPPMQLADTAWIGKNPITPASVAPYSFPFGGFARNGDVLKVPFIGAYVIRLAGANTGPFIAMNSITSDAAMADAQLTTAAQRADETIGHFCPLAAFNPAQAAWKNNNGVGDPYHWAARLFDYVDVQVSDNDFAPNVDPAPSDVTLPKNPAPFKYPNAASISTTPTATSVANSTSSANGATEQTLGKQGLININTAPAYLLQQLPGIDAAMANAIVADRQANGPFRSIFDLNRVAAGLPGFGEFQSGDNNIHFTKIPPGGPPTPPAVPDNDLADDPGVAGGDFTADTVRNDFEERTLMISKISNLITTRSDTFTCYVLLQGWRNVGTASPTLAVQRRGAFFLDRNNMTSTVTQPTLFSIPSN